MTYDFKTQTPDTSFAAATAFLFGADSQSAANPSIYQGSDVVAGMIGGSSGQIQYNNSSAFGGAAALVYATSGTNLTITASGAAVVPLNLVGASSQTANMLNLTADGGSAGALFKVSAAGATTFQGNAIVTAPAAANFQLGDADAASPVAQTLSVQSVVTATADTAGAAFTIAGSQGTGSGAGGAINLQIAPAGGAGSTPNSLATILGLSDSGAAVTSPLAAAIGLTVTGAAGQTGNVLNLSANGGGAGALFNVSANGTTTIQNNAILTGPASATLQFGAADAASPTAQSLAVQSVSAGTTDVAGIALTVKGSRGTGTGTAGAINFQVAPASTTGSTQNTLATILGLAETGTTVTNPTAAGIGLTIAGAAAQTGNMLDLSSSGGSAGDLFSVSSDGTATLQNNTILTGPAAATLQLGAADAASPVAQAVAIQSVAAGTADTAGVALTVKGSRGTGTGTAGAINFQVAPAGGAGSAQNTLGTILGLAETGTTVTNPTAAGIALTIAGASAQTGNMLDLSASGGSAGDLFSVSADGTTTLQNNSILTGPAAATLQLGAADAASPVAQSLAAQSVVGGTTDVAGAALTVKGSRGTGTGTAGAINFQIAPASTTGSTQNTLATILGLAETGAAVTSPLATAIGFTVTGASAQSGNMFNVTSNGGSAGDLFSLSSDGTLTVQSNAILTGPAAATLQLGAADAASPTAQTVSVQSVAAGTADTAGVNLTVQGSQGTGTGGGGTISFQVAPAGGAGSSQNSLTTLLSLVETGTAVTSPTATAIGLTVTGAAAQTGNILNLTANGGGAGALFNVSADGTTTFQNNAIVTGPAAATLQLGAADAASPTAQSLAAQSVATGTADTAGVALTVKGSRGTGTGTAGAINFQIAPASGSSSTQNTLATILGLAETGTAITSPVAAAIGLTVTGAAAQSGNMLDVTSNGGSAGDLFSLASDGEATLQSNAILTAPAAATLQFGAADAASPVAQSLAAQSVVGGTADTAGAALTVKGSRGTGTGTAGAINFQIAPASGSGSTQNTLATILGLAETGAAITSPAAAAIGLTVTGAGSQTGNMLNVTSNGGSAGDLFSLSSNGTATLQSNAILTAPAAANLQLGAADAASPVAQSLRAQNVVAGTTDTAGANFTVKGSVGTGTGAGGQVILQTAPASTTGSSQNSLATGLTITAPAVNMQPSVVVGNQALATNATDGFLYITGGAGAPTGTPTTFTGRYALYYDATNHKLYIYDGGWLGGTAPGAWS